jgi:hypothetical protein
MIDDDEKMLQKWKMSREIVERCEVKGRKKWWFGSLL